MHKKIILCLMMLISVLHGNNTFDSIAESIAANSGRRIMGIWLTVNDSEEVQALVQENLIAYEKLVEARVEQLAHKVKAEDVPMLLLFIDNLRDFKVLWIDMEERQLRMSESEKAAVYKQLQLKMEHIATVLDMLATREQAEALREMGFNKQIQETKKELAALDRLRLLLEQKLQH